MLTALTSRHDRQLGYDQNLDDGWKEPGNCCQCETFWKRGTSCALWLPREGGPRDPICRMYVIARSMRSHTDITPTIRLYRNVRFTLWTTGINGTMSEWFRGEFSLSTCVGTITHLARPMSLRAGYRSSITRSIESLAHTKRRP